MAFASRIINTTIRLGTTPMPTGTSRAAMSPATFDDAGADTVSFSGLRAHVDLTIGGNALATANCRFWGLPLNLMNQLSLTSMQLGGQSVHSKISIAAGDSLNGVATVFVGDILLAQIDAAGQPDVALMIEANLIGGAATMPKYPVSVKGPINIATLIKQIADWMGWQHETNGVSGVLTDPYLWGSPKNQIQTLCDAAGVNWTLDHNTDPPTLAIWPKGAARGGTIALISPQTGMVASPQFQPYGITVTTEFNAEYRLGQKIQVQSMIKNACGTYTVGGPIHHVLDSLSAGGAWFSTLEAYTLYSSAYQ